MVFLKQNIAIMLMLLSFSAVAQNKTKIQLAFIESFTLEAQKNYDESAKVILELYDENSYEMNIRLGWLFYNADKLEESDEYYNVAVSLMPYAIEPKLGAVLVKAKLNKWNEIIELYKEILSIDSKNSTALYNLGLIYYNRGYFQAAYDLFKELNNLYPIDYSATLMHAWGSLKMGKKREARVLFQKVLLLYPNDESAKEGLKALQ